MRRPHSTQTNCHMAHPAAATLSASSRPARRPLVGAASPLRFAGQCLDKAQQGGHGQCLSPSAGLSLLWNARSCARHEQPRLLHCSYKQLTEAASADTCTAAIALWAFNKLIAVLGTLTAEGAPLASPATHVAWDNANASALQALVVGVYRRNISSRWASSGSCGSGRKRRNQHQRAPPCDDGPATHTAWHWHVIGLMRSVND